MKRLWRITTYLVISLACSSSIAANKCNLEFKLNGLENPLYSNSLTRLNILRNARGCPLSMHKIESIYKKSPKEIKAALEPYGYFQPSIRSRLIKNDKQWQAIFDIKPGLPTKVSRVQVLLTGPGTNNKKIREFINDLPIKKGDIFDVTKYDETKDKLYQITASQGYIKARFDKSRIQIDKDKRLAIITISLNTNQRYYYGNITFDKSVYADRFLKRFVNFKEGEPFSDQALVSLQEDMSSTFYFSSVSVTPNIEKARNHRVPIRIKVEAPRSQRYKIGIGFGTFTGPRLTTGVSFRRITNTGQHADLDLRLSNVLSSISAKYYIPGKKPLTDRWVGGLNYQKFSPENGESESMTVFGGTIRQYKNWTVKSNLNYLTERYQINEKPQRNSNLLYPSLNLAYKKTNDLLDPTEGRSLSITLQGTSKYFFSTTSFAQAEISGKWLTSPFDFARIIARGDFGYTVVKDLNKLPLTMQFVTGGPTSIRGFGDGDIGPGKYLALASLEYRNRIVGNWFGAIFYDIGTAPNSFGKPADGSETVYNIGAGLGIIYQSMVGPVKLYFAEAVSKKKRPKSVEFSIGPEF